MVANDVPEAALAPMVLQATMAAPKATAWSAPVDIAGGSNPNSASNASLSTGEGVGVVIVVSCDDADEAEFLLGMDLAGDILNDWIEPSGADAS